MRKGLSLSRLSRSDIDVDLEQLLFYIFSGCGSIRDYQQCKSELAIENSDTETSFLQIRNLCISDGEYK